MAAPLAPPAMKRADDIFFPAISFVMLAIVVIGFAPSYFLRGAVFAHLPSVLVHLHAAAFSTWIILFAVQSTLVATGNVRMHRKLGWFGAFIATAMVILGITATFGTLHRGVALPVFFTPASFMVSNDLGILLFGAMVAVAIWKRNNRKVHKRLMVIANVMLLPPALSRIPAVQHHLVLVPLVCLGLISALFVFDLFTWRKPLLVTVVGGAIFFVSQPLMSAIAKTAPVQRLASWAQHHP